MKPLPWPQRLLRAVPPIPDWLWAGFLLLIVFLLGIAVGQALCMWTQTKEVQRISLQYQLDGLEKRLRALEPR